MLKKKGGKNSDGTNISKKSEQASIVEKAEENPCDVLTSQTGKRKYSDAWLLDSQYTSHMCLKREWFDAYKHYDGGSIRMGNNIVCKTVGFSNILMSMFNRQVRTFMNMCHIPNLNNNLLSLGALEAQRYKFSGADGGIKVIKDSMMILKGEQTTNLYKMTGSVIVSDASTTMRRRILKDLGTCVLDT